VDGNGSSTGNKSPVTMTVTDTSSSSVGCSITSWDWDWGDGVITYDDQTPAPHVFYNFGPPANVTYSITLTVTNAAGSSTSAAVIITVKK
jgi:PKD repeat protein